MTKKIIGIDLGGTTTKIAILDQDGEILQQWSISTDTTDNGVNIIPDIISSLKHRMKIYNMTSYDFLGIGMGAPGKVDRKLGTVTGAYNLNWSSIQNVRKELQSQLHLDVFLDNDANVAALGEQWKGAGNNESDVVFITLGTGVGGGIITNGVLVHGIVGSAGEIGHIGVDRTGYKCTCGNRGCLETVASATGIVKVARAESEKFAGNSNLKQELDSGVEVTSKDIFDAAKAGDQFAILVVEKICDFLGTACANIANILNPSSIILGGGVSAAGEFLRTHVEEYFKYTAFPQIRESTKIKLATRGNDAGVIGAASLVLNK